METNFTISQGTASLLSALKTFQDFHAEFYAAIEQIYGEENANTMDAAALPVFNAVEAEIGKHLMFSITENMLFPKNQNNEI